MTCAKHPESEASAFCRECGKPMCPECQRPALGSVYCVDHAPAAQSGNPTATGYPPPPPPPPPSFKGAPYAAPPPPPPPYPGSSYPGSPYTATGSIPPNTKRTSRGPSPALAFLLGFIPGVGAIYNGQYAKGLVHAVIFGILVSLASSHHNGLEPLIGISMAIWTFYMAFEAMHTAQKRREGIVPDEFSSLLNVHQSNGRFPVGAVLMIGFGCVLLLDTLGVISLDQLERFWPLGLIGFGVWRLYARMNPPATFVPKAAQPAPAATIFPGIDNTGVTK